MTDIGQRAYLMCALPAPALTSSEAAPLQTTDVQMNNRVVCWWSGRRDLGAYVRNVQTATLRKELTLVELFKQLTIAYQSAVALWQEWQRIFQTLYARGSTVQVYTEFVPHWCILTPAHAHLVYDYARDHVRAVPPIGETEHANGSLIFESVCLLYLQAALLQQMASVTQMLERSTEADAQALLVKPTNRHAIEHLRAARKVLKLLLEDTLPLYAATNNGSDTFLLSSHFYLQCIGGIVVAQQCHAHALEQHAAMANENSTKSLLIDAAAYLAQSSALLSAVALTPYVNRRLIISLAQYRRATALLTLAQLFSMCEREPLTDAVLTYAGTEEAWDQRAQAVAAYYCARGALALAYSVESMKRCFADTAERLRMIYGITVPGGSILSSAPPQHVIDDVLSSAVARTSDSAWRSEYGTIALTVEFECEQASVNVPLHSARSTNILTIGDVHHFMLNAAVSLK